MKYPIFKKVFRSKGQAEEYASQVQAKLKQTGRDFYVFTREYRGNTYVFTNSNETKGVENLWKERLKTR